MLKQTKILAAGLMGAMLLASTPAATFADGAASTRNILIGGAAAAAATLIIINHNKKVHEKYAADAQQQAALAQQRDDAQTAAHQYKLAYENETQVAQALKKQVAIQQDQISKLQTQIAALNPPGSNFVAAKPVAATATHTIGAAPNQQVVSYGWGTF
jgi:uncharacterized protein HemX